MNEQALSPAIHVRGQHRDKSIEYKLTKTKSMKSRYRRKLRSIYRLLFNVKSLLLQSRDCCSISVTVQSYIYFLLH